MDLVAVEKKKEKLKLEVKGETHTLLNLLREKSWQAGAKQASYIIEHPYLSDPKIIVIGSNPKKTLTSATQLIIDDAKEFERVFKRVSRR